MIILPQPAMTGKQLFFAGGGTGGHIYPAIAVAERAASIAPDCRRHLFCSRRAVDLRIMSEAGCSFTALPGTGFAARPDRAAAFLLQFLRARRIAKARLRLSQNPVVLATGGFVSAAVCSAAVSLKIPVVLLNLDAVAGRAAKLIARRCERVYVQFEGTVSCFSSCREKVVVSGCPLRAGFEPGRRRKPLSLGSASGRKLLVVMGGSMGSQDINRAVCGLLDRIAGLRDEWQIVHIAGAANTETVLAAYRQTDLAYKVVGYFEDMPDLLAAADLVVGRSGAVSVAECTAAAAPAIYMPYPHHRDRQQYLNAAELERVGAAVVVEDAGDDAARTASLWERLEPLMRDEAARQRMAQACRGHARLNAAGIIARDLLGL